MCLVMRARRARVLLAGCRRQTCAGQEPIVIVEIHTDNYIQSSERLKTQVEALVASAVDRFADRISRARSPLGEENSDTRGGAADTGCMMEPRLDGRPPLAVTH